SWTFSAAEGEVLSFVLRPTTGNIDPVMSISNSAGTILLANDDYAYPDSPDSMLEAVTIPRRDTYTLIVSGFGATAGEYTLTMFIGFANEVADDTFENARQWTSSGSPLAMNVSDGQMNLSLSGVQESSFVVSTAE